MVIFGVTFDYKEKNIDRLITVIEEIRRLKNPSEIHLRFHPREKSENKKHIEQSFEFAKYLLKKSND